MKELALKYGCNPNQKPSRIFIENGELPITVLNGKPGYIGFGGFRAERACSRRVTSQMSQKGRKAA